MDGVGPDDSDDAGADPPLTVEALADLQAGLLDELQLVIAPALKIQGRRLFDNGTPRKLTLTRSVTSPNGYLLLDFRV